MGKAAPDNLRSHVRAGYDALAPEYARVFTRELEGKPLDRELLTRFAAIAGRGAHVADVGCGPGHIGAYLGSLGLRVTGLDLSLPMMKAGRDVATHDRGASRPSDFVQADMTALPLRNESLAGLVAFYSIIHLRREDVPVAMAGFHRVLRPGAPLLLSVHAGRDVIATPNMIDQGVRMFATLFTKSEIDRELGSAGFVLLDLIQRASYSSESSTQRLYALARKSDGRI